MKLLVVYNPFSGNNRARKLLPKIKKLLISKSFKFDLFFTDYPQHGLKVVRDADFKNYDGLVAAGGDGTLFEIVNGYFQNQSSKRVPIGIIPIGTGNAFVRDLGLESDHWADAIEIISQNKSKKIDVGQFETQNKVLYFLNVLGLGFVSEVIKTTNKLKLFGNFAYTLSVFLRIMTLKNYYIKIAIDGKTLERDNLLVEISNTRYTSNFLMAPNAKVDDGLLDVTLFSHLSRLKLIHSFPKIFTGEHVNMDEVETFQAKHINIATDSPKVLSPDGELTGFTPVDVRCLHQAIDVFWK